MKENYDAMMEEIESTTNLIEKDMLLQKYGLIPPKLTQEERDWAQHDIYYDAETV